MTLSYSELHDAVVGTGVGVRARTPLEPLGGSDEKIFPPTYDVDGSATTRYAVESRRVEGEESKAVVLDAVASQANRMELALLEAHRRGELAIPLVSVDFREAVGVEGLDKVTSLEAPHRVFDAILRDSLLDGVLFRHSEIGQAVTEASARDAAAIFRHAPHTLVFGGWDSTGPRGGRGAKYERALTSEIVATGVLEGVRTSSRIDPLGIEKEAGPVYETKDGGWTLDEEEAAKEGGKPKRVGEKDKDGKKGKEPGRPSQINHGNVTPSLDALSGGVTAKEIIATAVLSFVQLRRLRFPLDTSGAVVADDRRRSVETAGHVVLAALGLAATVLSFEDGFDLRSRCVLRARDDLKFELLQRGSTPDRDFTLDRIGALELLETARVEAAAVGLDWATEEIVMRPFDGLVELVRKSQEIAAGNVKS